MSDVGVAQRVKGLKDYTRIRGCFQLEESADKFFIYSLVESI